MSLPISGLAGAVETAHADAKAAYTNQKEKLTKATQDFEALFLGMMMKQMRKSMAGEDALFGKSQEAKIYQDMMDDSLAQQMSRSGTFGLARVMMKSIASGLPPDPDAPKSSPKL